MDYGVLFIFMLFGVRIIFGKFYFWLFLKFIVWSGNMLKDFFLFLLCVYLICMRVVVLVMYII